MDRLIAVLRAIGEPSRLRILALLADGELTVTELVQILGQSQPRVSRHLRLLAETGLVARHPEGAWVFYRLARDEPSVSGLMDHILTSASADDPVRRRDLDRLAGVKASRADAAATYFQSVASDWDRVRALQVGELDVEAALLNVAGPGPFRAMVDVGSGTGRMLEVFADRIDEGVGVDLSHDMLTVARAKLDRAGARQCSVRHGDLYALPFGDGAADLVVIHQVLHYLTDPAAAFAEAARVLAAGGVLVLADFAPHDLEFLRTEHAHRRLGFSDDDVGGWIASAGLSPGDVRTLAPGEGAGSAQLTVKIWSARRPAVATPIRPTALSQPTTGDAA